MDMVMEDMVIMVGMDMEATIMERDQLKLCPKLYLHMDMVMEDTTMERGQLILHQPMDISDMEDIMGTADTAMVILVIMDKRPHRGWNLCKYFPLKQLSYLPQFLLTCSWTFTLHL